MALRVPLQNVRGSLILIKNSCLTNLQFNDTLTRVGQNLTLIENGFVKLHLKKLFKVIGTVEMKNNNRLIWIAMSELRLIARDFLIEHNSELKSLSDFENLEMIGGHLRIQMNDELESIDGISAIKSVQKSVTVSYNPMLKKANKFLAGLILVNDYVKVDLLNGTIQCPKGTKVGAHGSMMKVMDNVDIDIGKFMIFLTI